MSPTSAITNSRVSAARIQFTQQQTREVAPLKIRLTWTGRQLHIRRPYVYQTARASNIPLYCTPRLLVHPSSLRILDTRQLLRSLKVIAINITPNVLPKCCIGFWSARAGSYLFTPSVTTKEVFSPPECSGLTRSGERKDQRPMTRPFLADRKKAG